MANTPNRHTIPGSERAAVTGARATGQVMADERIEVSVLVRPASGQRDLADSEALVDKPPAQRNYLSRDEFATHHGADRRGHRQGRGVRQGARAGGRRVERGAPQRGAVGHRRGDERRLRRRRCSSSSTTAAPIAAAPARSASRPIWPASSKACSASTTGRRRRRTSRCSAADRVGDRARSPAASFTPPQLATLYDFPTGADGSGQCIAHHRAGRRLQAGRPQAYFSGLGLPVPERQGGAASTAARNHPTNANSADGEVMLDIEVAAAIAPKAHDRRLLRAEHRPGLPRRDHDGRARQRQQAVGDLDQLGPAETNWTAQAMTQFDQAFQAAARWA